MDRRQLTAAMRDLLMLHELLQLVQQLLALLFGATCHKDLGRLREGMNRWDLLLLVRWVVKVALKKFDLFSYVCFVMHPVRLDFLRYIIVELLFLF